MERLRPPAQDWGALERGDCYKYSSHPSSLYKIFNPSMHLRRETDDGFGCGMGPALTVSTGVKMGIRVLLLRRHHPQRVRLLWSTRFGVGSTK